ncbi:hypothetical protein Vretimale_13882, partial [Volvox reticuliferus]
KQDPEIKQQSCRKKAAQVARILRDAGTAAEWGLEASLEMVRVPARVLARPILQYGTQQAIDVGTTGSWTLRNVQFTQPARIESWGVAVLMSWQKIQSCGSQSVMQAFVDGQEQMLRTCGMHVVQGPPPIEFQAMGPLDRNTEATMRAAAARAEAAFHKPAQILLVIISDKSTEEYREIKRVSDIELGILSQVVVASKAKIGINVSPQYYANVAQKVNVKVGGVNGKLFGELLYLPVLGGPDAPPFMVMGADVSHASAGPGPRLEPSVPSVAAVVASWDKTLGHWSSRVMHQTSQKEIIIGMQSAAKELLQEFRQRNRGFLPQRVLMYRDGVGEGQFDQVLAEEYTSIVRACAEVEPFYKPAITYVVVQKAHNTRLFAERGSLASDPKGNAVPGTVVDTGIVSPDGFDFYLNSHAGLQGTNRPAHYHVLVDEIGFGTDGLELLTYWMCYLYQRATKSVSFCPPAYYA